MRIPWLLIRQTLRVTVLFLWPVTDVTVYKDSEAYLLGFTKFITSTSVPATTLYACANVHFWNSVARTKKTGVLVQRFSGWLTAITYDYVTHVQWIANGIRSVNLNSTMGEFHWLFTAHALRSRGQPTWKPLYCPTETGPLIGNPFCFPAIFLLKMYAWIWIGQRTV